MVVRLSRPAYLAIASSSLLVVTWRILLWRARTRARKTVERVKDLVKKGPLIDYNNPQLRERILEAAIKRASKWMSLIEEAMPMVGQVGGRCPHKRPMLTLSPERVLKPLHTDRRGIREVAFYEAVETASQNPNNHTYSMFLSGKDSFNSVISQGWELVDTVSLALAISLKDPCVQRSEKDLRKAWKSVKREIDALHRLTKFIPRYRGVIGQKGVSASLSAPFGVTGDSYLLLQSLTSSFSMPCVMDLKMGTQTFEPDAPEDKQQREAGKYLHQEEFGFRIIGMRIYDPSHPEADEKGFRLFEKKFGRSLDTRESVTDAFRIFFSSGCAVRDIEGENSKPPERVRMRTISNILLEMRSLRRWFEENKSLRFIASSLLLVYEGDPVKGNGDVTMLRMIDFCHVRREPGGDRGYMVGLKTLRNLLADIQKEEENRGRETTPNRP